MSGSHGHDEPLPEPKTPMWLPALGAALFLLGAMWWTLSPSNDGAGPQEGAASTTTVASAAASASAAPAAQPPQGAPGGGGAPQINPVIRRPSDRPMPSRPAAH